MHLLYPKRRSGSWKKYEILFWKTWSCHGISSSMFAFNNLKKSFLFKSSESLKKIRFFLFLLEIAKEPWFNNFFQTSGPFLISGRITFVSYYLDQKNQRNLKFRKLWKVVYICFVRANEKPFNVRHIGSTIFNSENPMSDSQAATPKACEYRVSRKSYGFQNYMSDILDIRHFAKSMAIWDRWDNFFLAVQLFRSLLTIVSIKFQYSFGSKKNYEKENSWFFGTFLQIWRHIGFSTGPSSILTTDSWRAYLKL